MAATVVAYMPVQQLLDPLRLPGLVFGVVLGEGRMLPDFEAALIGMKAGEDKSFDLTFPADYQPELAGKTVQFAMTAKVVNAPKLPPVDTV